MFAFLLLLVLLSCWAEPFFESSPCEVDCVSETGGVDGADCVSVVAPALLLVELLEPEVCPCPQMANESRAALVRINFFMCVAPRCGSGMWLWCVLRLLKPV